MRIQHDGPINNTERYWKPETVAAPRTEATGIDSETEPKQSESHAYFRGRRLHGTTLKLPENYTGAVVQTTEKTLPQKARRAEDDEENEEEQVEVKIAETLGEFDEVVVWGHGGVVDEKEDVYVRGVREWIEFAEAMHGVDEEDEEDAGAKKSA